VRQILEKCWEQNIAVHNLFIEFRAALDTVWREEYGVKCVSWSPPPKKVISCRIRDNKIYVKVKIGKHILNVKLTKAGEKEMQLLLCCLM
jgi:hypothetical protein